MDQICILHIGKTGGTYLKSWLKGNDLLSGYRSIHILNHNSTILSTKKKYGLDRKLIFCFRNPIERFHSAFYSRQRQARPTYSYNWTNAEAISFMYFDSSNELAEALESNDQKMRSAAHYAMNSIQHLKQNYQYYLSDIDTLRLEKNNIIACVETSELDSKIDILAKILNLPIPSNKETINKHENKNKNICNLTTLGSNNLKKYWEKEFLIYDYLLTIKI